MFAAFLDAALLLLQSLLLLLHLLLRRQTERETERQRERQRERERETERQTERERSRDRQTDRIVVISLKGFDQSIKSIFIQMFCEVNRSIRSNKVCVCLNGLGLCTALSSHGRSPQLGLGARSRSESDVCPAAPAAPEDTDQSRRCRQNGSGLL